MPRHAGALLWLVRFSGHTVMFSVCHLYSSRGDNSFLMVYAYRLKKELRHAQRRFAFQISLNKIYIAGESRLSVSDAGFPLNLLDPFY